MRKHATVYIEPKDIKTPDALSPQCKTYYVGTDMKQGQTLRILRNKLPINADCVPDNSMGWPEEPNYIANVAGISVETWVYVNVKDVEREEYPDVVAWLKGVLDEVKIQGHDAILFYKTGLNQDYEVVIARGRRPKPLEPQAMDIIGD